MNKEQPEALRLAAWLNEGAWNKMTLGDVEAAGRELRRLHAENTRLLKAVDFLLDVYDESHMPEEHRAYVAEAFPAAIEEVRAALSNAKATGTPPIEASADHLLPYDVVVGGNTFRKGVRLSTFIHAAQYWHRTAFTELYELTDEQRTANLAALIVSANGATK